jgi:archaellum component FlaC
VDQEFRSIRGRFDKLENDVQGVYVTVESLEGKIQLVAEGVTTVSHQLQRQGEEISHRLDSVESFNRLLYKDLDSRMRRSRRPKV